MSLSISQSGGDCLLLHLLHLLKEEGLYGSQETQFTASADLIPAQNWLYDSYCCSTEREMRQNVLFTPSQGKIVTRVHYYVQNFQKFLIFLLLNLMANFCWIFPVRRSGFGHIWSPEKSKVALARSLALLLVKDIKKSYFGVILFLLSNFPNVRQRYKFVTKDVKMIWLSSVHAWLMKPKTEAQFKFLATRNVTGWYQLSSQQVNFDRLSGLWFPFYLFIWIFDQLICLQSLI